MAEYIRALAGEHKDIVIAICNSIDVVSEAKEKHRFNLKHSQVFGEGITGAYLMHSLYKSEDSKTNLTFTSDGDIRKMNFVVAKDVLKGYIDLADTTQDSQNTNIELNFGSAGSFNFQRDIGVGSPFTGSSQLINDDIASNLTYYYMMSEQVPTVVILDVLSDQAGTLTASGGLIVQLLPNAAESSYELVRSRIDKLSQYIVHIQNGMPIADIFKEILGDCYPYHIIENRQFAYHCDCSRYRVESALISIGLEELNAILTEQGRAEMHCHYCNQLYHFTGDDLTHIIHRLEEEN